LALHNRRNIVRVVNVEKSAKIVEDHQSRQQTKGKHGMRKHPKPLAIHLQRNENAAHEHVGCVDCEEKPRGTDVIRRTATERQSEEEEENRIITS
jgi:hypothetical protein